MRLDKFDLNLLVALDALLEERNVTRTAERLGLTQSGVSAALSRLRQAFDDDLLVQHGRRMVLTPHAEALRPEIRRTINELRGLLSRTSAFDHTTSKRRFRLAASDYIATVLLAPLIESLADRAPGIAFEVILPHAGIDVSLANGDVDILFSPSAFLHPDHPSETLLEERYVLAGWSENPLMAEPLTKKRFVEASHIAVSITGKQTHFEEFLSRKEIERRVGIQAPSFLQAPFFISGTEHVCVMHERLARIMCAQLPIDLRELPFEVPPMLECLQYHEARQRDLGLAWLLGEIRALAARI